MWQMRIIRYIPANTSPMIFFDEERLPTKDVYISPDTYIHRKRLISERFCSMVDYANNNLECRSVLLQRHFGDNEAQPCGICDICLAERRRKKQEAANKNAECENIDINSQVTAKILSIINQSPLSAREVMREVGGEPQFIGKIIDELKAEGKIYLSNEGKLVINE
jgi:ATP-dependent DNA helicase RecQ